MGDRAPETPATSLRVCRPGGPEGDGSRHGSHQKSLNHPLFALHAFLKRAVRVEALYDCGLDISRVKLRVVWRGIGRRKPTTTTFQLLMPDGTDLSDDPKHQVIRRYLTRWQLAA